jgi:hypothetical protein
MPMPGPPPGPVLLLWQVPEVQVSPELHAIEPQHGCPVSPHGPGIPPGPVPASIPPVMPIWQIPPMQDSPELHATPPQQVSLLPPQGAGMPPELIEQLPRRQESPELHAVPPQQG